MLNSGPHPTTACGQTDTFSRCHLRAQVRTSRESQATGLRPQAWQSGAAFLTTTTPPLQESQRRTACLALKSLPGWALLRGLPGLPIVNGTESHPGGWLSRSSVPPGHVPG